MHFSSPNLLLLGYKRGNPLVNYVHKMSEDFTYMAHHSMLGTEFDSDITDASGAYSLDTPAVAACLPVQRR